MSDPADDLRVNARCPACGTSGILLRNVQHDVPHFGETLQTLVLCDACGFRHVDFFVVEEKDPVRYTFTIESPEDLNARVVRSGSGTVRIPDLGFVAEPGTRTEAFVSNVEGLLQRMRKGFQWAESVVDTEEERDIARERMERMDEAMEGNLRVTIIIEDPFGNSAIVHERAERDVLSRKEAEELETGMIVLDREDVVEAVDPDEGDDGETRA